MAQSEIEEIEPPKQTKKKTERRKHGSTPFFIFIDYLFLLVFFGFLGFIVLKFFGI